MKEMFLLHSKKPLGKRNGYYFFTTRFSAPDWKVAREYVIPNVARLHDVDEIKVTYSNPSPWRQRLSIDGEPVADLIKLEPASDDKEVAS